MGYRTIAYAFYARACARIAPRLLYSQRLYEDALARHVVEGTTWLDLGCGHQVLPAWRRESERRLVDRARVVGLDADVPSLRSHQTIHLLVQGDIGALPFADGTFDLVTLNMVAEHLDHPAVQFAEIRRVLRPGGAFLLHTPNTLGYLTLVNRCLPHAVSRRLARIFDGRPAADVFPAYYRANSPRRLRRLAAGTGLELSDVQLVTTSAIFVVAPPLVVLELLWIRLLMTRAFRPFRTNLIALLRKPAETAERAQKAA
jgi:ubiquinone/menaquinone biosynthesis C-methylase UbiE